MLKKLKEFIKNLNPKARRVLVFLCTLFIFLSIWTGVQYKNAQNTDAIKFYNALDNAEVVPYNEFTRLAINGEVDSLYYHTAKEQMAFTLYNEDSKKLPREQLDEYEYDIEYWRVTTYPSGESFRAQMLGYNINLILVRDNTSAFTILQWIITILPSILLLYFMIAMLQKMGNGLSDVKADDVIQKSDTKLSDIIGLDELKDDISLVVNLIKDPKYGEEIGVKVPSGILLSGPPGVGKTMIAKGISNEADVPFIQMNGSDFQELYVGNGARRVRQLFKLARENSPCIIFIDEFDAIGEKRDSLKSSSEDSRTINALLKEMDGFKELTGVFVLAATNNPEKLDAAVKRSGRFDREIVITPPRDWTVRYDMFKHYLKDKKVSDDVDLETLARTVSGFTGADIDTVCNEAGIVALSHGKTCIDHESIEEAIDKKLFKGSRSKRKVNEEDHKIVAYHEAGHAVMSILTGTPVSRASIASTTSGVGGAVFHEDKDSQFRTSKDFEDRIKVCYAGRASEEIKFNVVTTGASNDITQATNEIMAYINRYGFMKSAGMLDWGQLTESGVQFGPDKSQQVTKFAISMYDKTLDTLKKNYHMVEKLANRLLEVGAMTGKEITEFLGVNNEKESKVINKNNADGSADANNDSVLSGGDVE